MRLAISFLVYGVLGAGTLGLTACPGEVDDPGSDGTTSGAGSSTGSGDGGSNNITASTIDPSDTLPPTTAGDTMDGSTAGEEDTMSVDTTDTATSDTSGVESTDTMTSTDTGSTGDSGSTGAGATDSGSTGMMTSSTSGSPSTSDTGSTSGSSTTGSVCNSAAGNYDACLNAMGQPSSPLCGFAGATCINDGADPAFATTCSLGNCMDDCDCPAGPGTGNAVVTCDDITDDATNECYLDCSNGETCPTGMGCFIDLVCVWDSGTGPQPYDACSGTIECPPEYLCVVDDTMTPTQGVCTPEDCSVASDCPAGPTTGNATLTCQDIAGDSTNDCWLGCTSGETCPDGMQCLAGILCVWPLP